jgi:hypothetical protein
MQAFIIRFQMILLGSEQKQKVLDNSSAIVKDGKVVTAVPP